MSAAATVRYARRSPPVLTASRASGRAVRTMNQHCPLTLLLRLSGLALSSLMTASLASASDLHRYDDADLALGARLIREHQCDACHARRVGGTGADIYRPKGRINTPGALRGMVDYCSVELKLQLFPEEVTSIAAVLQRDHYRFPASRR